MNDTKSAKQILDVIPRTMRIIRTELRALAKSELTVPQFRILAHLTEGPLNNGQLADIQGVSVAAMSRMVDGLVRRELLTRTVGANDRRQTLLALTPSGRETMDRITKAVQKSLAERISKLSTKPKKDLASGLDALEEVFS